MKRPFSNIFPVMIGATLAALTFSLFFLGDSQSVKVCEGGFPPQTLASLAKGNLAALRLHDRPAQAPDLRFRDAENQEKTLADFHGKVLLINLWATWCAPCRAEMPALNRIKEKLPERDFDVIAINMDVNADSDPRGFLKKINAQRLAFYADPEINNFKRLRKNDKIHGLPTTFLIDRNGCETGALHGPAPWDAPEAVTLLERMIAYLPHEKKR